MTASTDPLLTAARVAIIIIRIVIVLVALAIVAVSILVLFGPGAPRIQTVAGTSPAAITAGVLTLVVLVGVVLGLSYDFVGRLTAIIDTVRVGEPFTSANASRLTRMAWLSLTIQLISIPLAAVGAWLQPLVKDEHIRIDVQLSASGFILALVLFILARVFRQGAAMREELEGTV